MNLVQLLKDKSQVFEGTDLYLGIEAVIHHIEIAETHFERAKEYGEHLYTDVIYRTNQAFEGALKEAYRVLAAKDPSKQSPFHIEKYFENNKLLKERVLAQFTNYRTEWRNKSTHDYQLFFSSQEAFLAIVSISAFFNILLDQMVERYSYKVEKEELNKESYSLLQRVKDFEQLDFLQQCVELLRHFSASLTTEPKLMKGLSEYEILGRLCGFISATAPNIKFTSDKPIYLGSTKRRLDLLLEKGDRAVIVEVKRPSREILRHEREGIDQVKSYLAATGLTEGIVFIPQLNNDTTPTLLTVTRNPQDMVFNVTNINASKV